MAARIVPAEVVEPIDHPNAAQLNPESVEALRTAKEHPGEWIIWQSGFAHHKASKTQAYNLRLGKRQKTLTEGLLPGVGNHGRGELTFRSWTDPSTGEHLVLAKFVDG